MLSFHRVTDETVGLILSCLLVVTLIYDWQGLGVILAILLVVFFLFRLSWGKGRAPRPRRRRY